MRKNGFSIIEVIMSIGVASMVVLGFTYINFQNIRISQHNILSLQANLYAMEAMEVAKNMEMSNWGEFDKCESFPGSECYPVVKEDGGEWVWEFVEDESEGVLGDFKRVVLVEDQAGFFPSKKVTTTISWRDGLGEHDITVETYVYQY